MHRGLEEADVDSQAQGLYVGLGLLQDWYRWGAREADFLVEIASSHSRKVFKVCGQISKNNSRYSRYSRYGVPPNSVELIEAADQA
jgi:hypothetical protein